MKDKVSKIEQVFIGAVIIILILGIGLNEGLRNSGGDAKKELFVGKEEKDYIEKFGKDSNRDFEQVENTYFKYLEIEKNKGSKINKHNIGRIKFFLGLNRYLNGEYDKAKPYFIDAKAIFVEAKSYFYTLTLNNFLINIFYFEEEYIETINIANESYEIISSERIKKIIDKDSVKIGMNILSGFLRMASSLDVLEIAEMYYDELNKLTTKFGNETLVTLYAKYLYNFKIGDYKEAQVNALDYIQAIKVYKKGDEFSVDVAQFLLLEIYTASGELEKSKESFYILRDAYKDKNNKEIDGILLSMEGLYFEKEGKYTEAVQKYEAGLNKFEEIDAYKEQLELIRLIIRIREKEAVDINLNVYVDKAIAIEKKYGRKKILSELADYMNYTVYQKNQKVNNGNGKRTFINQNIVMVSNIMALIYIVITVVIIMFLRKFKKELRLKKNIDKEIERLSKKDYLTKADSKNYIFEKIEKYIEKKEKFTFIFFDIDNLNKINEKFGYRFGDEILVNIVREIEETIAEIGSIGRFGGDEFIIILDESVDARLIISLIKAKIANIKYSKEGVRVKLSIVGIQWSNQDIEELMQISKRALSDVKENRIDKMIIKK
ncbi:GGDEF domain-containing protein [uncultured Clostridium sp.]|jgi:diguanylate cyclase (GGDEF)-like protein|uniref:GGDEF domain-containing protein n=1 Tax=uncultured Clostridium sp. TaxID=59620 RepID=UPI002637611B|nr:GGDEF domain-containing protein [uncultured Clostridium sp.]